MPLSVRLRINVRVWVRVKVKFPHVVRFCVTVRVRTKLMLRLRIALDLDIRLALRFGLRRSTRLCLRFVGNGIGDEGAKQLVNSLKNNATLTSLDLRGTRLGLRSVWFAGNGIEGCTFC